MREQKSQRIFSTIQRQIVLISAIVSLATLAILLLLYDLELKKIERAEATQRMENHLFLISSLLRVADYKTLKDVVNVIAEDKNIKAIHIDTPTGNVIAAAGNYPIQKEHDEDSLVHAVESSSQPSKIIGKVHIYRQFGRQYGLFFSKTVLIPTIVTFLGTVLLELPSKYTHIAKIDYAASI